MEAEQNRTSLLTQNHEDHTDQMDLLEELYSQKNLVRRQRKLSKAKSDLMNSSRRLDRTSTDDFVKIIFQSDDQVVSWGLLALLQQYKNMLIVGIWGRLQEVQQFMKTLTSHHYELPNDLNDCLFFSNKWKSPRHPQFDCCFIVRLSDRRSQWQSGINDVMFSILPHLTIILQSDHLDMMTYVQSCRRNRHLLQSITRIDQSLIVMSDRKQKLEAALLSIPSSNRQQRIQLFTQFELLYSNSPDYIHQQAFLSSLQRAAKRNSFVIFNIEPVVYYYLAISLWTYCKGLTNNNQDMFGRINKPMVIQGQLSNIDVPLLSSKFLKVVDKELRFNFKQKAEEYLKGPRDDFELYQLFKNDKEETMLKLKKYCSFVKPERTQIYKRLNEYMEEMEEEVMKWNDQTNFRNNLALAQQAAQPLINKMQKGLYRSSQLHEFRVDFDVSMALYSQRAVGQSKGLALSEFLKSLTPQIFKYFDGALRDEIKETVDKRQQSQPIEGLQAKIQMVQNNLYTVEKELAELQRRRQNIEKTKRKLHKESHETNRNLRDTKQQISKIRRVMNTEIIYMNRKNSTRMNVEPSPRHESVKKSRCSIF